MTSVRVSHMESCLHCGTTTSSTGKSNDYTEEFIDRYIGLAVRCGDVAALDELAKHELDNTGLYFSGSGSAGEGPRALSKLRRFRIARKACEAAEKMLELVANDEHHFDSNGHLI